MDSDDYMNMLNNPVINPSRSQVKKQDTAPKLPTSFAFAKVSKASTALTTASQDLYLESETDAPFIWVNSDWTKPAPPETKQELIECEFLDEAEKDGPFSTESLDAFFSTLPDTHQGIREAFRTISSPEATKVYRVGEDASMTVLVLAVVEDVENAGVYSLVGLKSLLVMT
ncbi:hypothetical protein K501DRAFT_286556 [Backusella circina FSU 941]|nr:hypothetical protein K501DRAFT_286556 [Backusella circina FSU 941]